MYCAKGDRSTFYLALSEAGPPLQEPGKSLLLRTV